MKQLKKIVTPQPLHFGIGISTVKMAAKFEILRVDQKTETIRLSLLPAIPDTEILRLSNLPDLPEPETIRLSTLPAMPDEGNTNEDVNTLDEILKNLEKEM